MVEFARYYISFIRTFFSNIWNFIKSLFEAFGKFLYTDIVGYFKQLIDSSVEFTVLDWICLVIVFSINIAFFTFIILRIIQAIRRKIHFKYKKVEKEELLEEIAALNYKIEELIEEKNKVFAMKVSNLGLKPGGREEDEDTTRSGKPKEGSKKTVPTDSRFVKLISVDKEYELQSTIVNMSPEDMIGLPELTEKFINFSASQMRLFYERKVAALFFAGMATSKIMILEGISGTGKTSLPYAMGKFFRNDCSIVSVQPSWRDRAEIIGYLNEFTKRFNETDFLKALYTTTYREDLNFIVLDEMNLARIEYYFAEFLSIMEMPDVSEWNIDIVPDTLPSDPKNLINGKLLVPQNVWFVGTANKDDSTFTITDKVYDRATVIEMNAKAKYIDAPSTPSTSMSFEYMDNLFKKAEEDYSMSTKSLDNLAKLDAFIRDNFKITFGNRILKQIKIFVPVYVGCGFNENEGLDYFIARKVLRKFESLNLSFLHKEMDDLISFLDKLYGKNVFKESIEYIKELKKNS